MKTWQIDFYKHTRKDEEGKPIWELLICSPQGDIIHEANCPQSQANSDWLVAQLQQANQGNLPDLIQVFRPQSVTLLSTAAEKLGIKIEATRRTNILKAELQKRFIDENYDPVKLEKLPPQALPENLWGEEWRFVTLGAGDLIDLFSDRPIPIVDMPESLSPINLGIASSVPVPGTIIYGGKKSMILARWLQEAKPFSLNYIPTELGKSGGLVLESGLSDRWIIATFEDEEVAQAAQNYEPRKQASLGLHFLVVQPDESGMTYSGFWLLKDE
jgi:sRNA-binding carbon storage regulator CsrA